MAYLHFVTNFGKMQKESLTEFEAASILSHLTIYAELEPLMHVQAGRKLAGLPATVRQIEHDKPVYAIQSEPAYKPLADAAGDADFVRAIVLKQYGGLYADLDIFALQKYAFAGKREVIGLEPAAPVCGTPNVGLIYVERGSVLPDIMLELLNTPMTQEQLQPFQKGYRPYLYLQGRLREHLHKFEVIARPRTFHGTYAYWYKRGTLADNISKRAYSIHAFGTRGGAKIAEVNPELYNELLSLHWL